jgi:group I intron endonuclease
MSKYIVYKHACPNNKVYIGITGQNPIKRWHGGLGYNRNQHFYRAILKYGWDNIQHEILYSELTKEEACEKEIELIALYKSNNPDYGYNMTSGGEHFEHNEISRKKLSESHKGKSHPHSEESKQKLSEAHKGKPKSEEHKRHLSEVRKAMGQPAHWNRKGKAPWNKGKSLHYENNFTRNRHKVINLDTGEIFESVTDARIKYNAVKIPQVCMGKRNKSGGYRWAYYEGGDA